MINNNLKAIDLFCGCGGISAGLKMAGYDIVAGVDIDPAYLQTFRHNFGEDRGLALNLSNTPPEKFANLIGIDVGEIDLLVGGPPCQGFSKNVPRSKRYLESQNNLLVKTFLDYCEILQPKSILMENVAEMKNGFDKAYSNEVLDRLNEAGYSVVHEVLNAVDYGIPQRRRRAFFLATRGPSKPRFPKPTHATRPLEYQLFPLKPYVTVWEAIGDLPSLEHGKGIEPCQYSCEPFSDFQREVRNSDGIVFNHFARRLQPQQFARLSSLNPGEGLKQLPDHLRPKSGYSGAYGRLTKDMIAPTITRWVFHPGSGRWGHPVDIRTLTIREAARIQGFPDSFKFIGTYTQQSGQLGNAVPPKLIIAIAKMLQSLVDPLYELQEVCH
jgi:DNA (cytosine-5)-methyltransferase 1